MKKASPLKSFLRKTAETTVVVGCSLATLTAVGNFIYHDRFTGDKYAAREGFNFLLKKGPYGINLSSQEHANLLDTLSPRVEVEECDDTSRFLSLEAGRNDITLPEGIKTYSDAANQYLI